jgi:hypothetical protein
MLTPLSNKLNPRLGILQEDMSDSTETGRAMGLWLLLPVLGDEIVLT